MTDLLSIRREVDAALEAWRESATHAALLVLAVLGLPATVYFFVEESFPYPWPARRTGMLAYGAIVAAACLRRQRLGQELREKNPGIEKLSPTERQVLSLIAEDRTSTEIAQLLGCSFRTIESHRQRISQKLRLSGSHSLHRFAFDHKAEL